MIEVKCLKCHKLHELSNLSWWCVSCLKAMVDQYQEMVDEYEKR